MQYLKCRAVKVGMVLRINRLTFSAASRTGVDAFASSDNTTSRRTSITGGTSVSSSISTGGAIFESSGKSGKALLQQMVSSAAMSSVDPGSRKDSRSKSEKRDRHANSPLISVLTCKLVTFVRYLETQEPTYILKKRPW